MQHQHFTISFLTDKTTQQAFEAINNVRGWWTENLEGDSHKLNDIFEVRFGDVHYSKQQITEIIPGKKVVWLVTDSRLNFLKDKTEWTNMKIVFEIAEKGKQTEVRFTQLGLLPEIECYNACSNAWNDYVQNSLRNLIDTGKGQPSRKEK